jgi:protein TonB
LFSEIGLLIALGFTLLAFEWQIAPTVEVKDEGVAREAIEEEVVPITRQEEATPPPPEPPKVTDILDIVADDVRVDSNIDINIEADQSTEIIAPVATEFVAAVIEEEEEEVLFAIVEEKPLFNGKDADAGFREWVYSKTVYPPVAQENGISGKVFIEFSISKTGEIVDVRVTRGVDPLLDNEALRVINLSPKWTPGMQRGKPVKVKYTFPFVFKLNN